MVKVTTREEVIQYITIELTNIQTIQIVNALEEGIQTGLFGEGRVKTFKELIAAVNEKL